MTTSAKSVHEFFNEDNSFFDAFGQQDKNQNPPAANGGFVDNSSSLLYSPISVESVSLSPNETPSPGVNSSSSMMVPEKRKVSSEDVLFGDDDDNDDIDDMYLPEDTPSSSYNKKTAKSDGASDVSSSKAAAAAAAAGRKPGRKPDMNEPENKRKAQNRAAQRAFRERKERHLKELEDRVDQLENEAASTSNENQFLRLQVERLQGELRKYRQTSRASTTSNSSATSPLANSTSSTAKKNNTILLNQDLGPSVTVNSSSTKPFTFEFPFFTGTDSKKSGSINNGMATVTTTSLGKSPVLGKESVAVSPSTASIISRRSTNDDSSPNSISSSSPDNNRRSSSLSSDAQPEEFCDQLSLACGTKDHPVPKVSSGSSSKGSPAVVINAGTIPWTSSASPVALTNNSSASSNVTATPSLITPSLSTRTPSVGGLFSPSDFDVDFISEYRDPLFDGEQFTLPELATSEYSMFDPLENPIANTTFEMLNKNADLQAKDTKNNNTTNTNNNNPAVNIKSEDDDETVPAYPTKLMSCTAVWDRICQHPKFGDIDIDGLCHELRAKAKCSDSGVLLTEKDVDKVLKAFS